MKYYFYFKNDKNKEALNSIDCLTKDEAIVYFSKLKKLEIDKFLEIYNVKIKEDYNEVR